MFAPVPNEIMPAVISPALLLISAVDNAKFIQTNELSIALVER